MTFHFRMKLLLLSLLLLKTRSTSKDFLTSFSNCHKNILMYSILHFQMYINSLNVEYKMLL